MLSYYKEISRRPNIHCEGATFGLIVPQIYTITQVREDIGN